MVIRFSLNNRAGTIERLCKDESYHLMRECHLGERNLLVGSVIYGLRETVGTAYHEYESASRSLLAFQPFGVLDTSEFLSMLIEQYHGVGWLYQFQDHFPLSFLLLLFAEALGVLELRDGSDIERHIVGDALGIVLDACDEMLINGLSDQYEFCLHVYKRLTIKQECPINY